MRKRFVFATVCILAFPLLFSASQSEKLTNPTAFSTVALAGHNTMGNWCECGTLGCICDPGEQPTGNSIAAPSNASSDDEGVNQGPAPDVDLASGMLALALVVLLWLRMR